MLYHIEDPRLKLFIMIVTVLIFINVIITVICNNMKEKLDMDNVLLGKINEITRIYGSDKVVEVCGDDIDLILTIIATPMLSINRVIKYSKLMVVKRLVFTGTNVFIVTNMIMMLIF